MAQDAPEPGRETAAADTTQSAADGAAPAATSTASSADSASDTAVAPPSTSSAPDTAPDAAAPASAESASAAAPASTAAVAAPAESADPSTTASDSVGAPADTATVAEPTPAEAGAAPVDTATAPAEAGTQPVETTAAPSDSSGTAATADTADTIAVQALRSDSAPAPPAEDDGAARLDAITVTAQKREQSINDVPVTVSAFNGEQLKSLGVTDVRDVGLLVPGLSVNDSGQGTPIYTLRGVGYNDTTYTASGTVGLYLDEVNLPYSAMSKGLSVDLERIEVLKGPQGTLYGRNTTGGLINQIANKPGDHLEFGGSATYQRFNTTDAEVYLSGPLGDTVRARVAARGVFSDQGWQYSNTRPDDTLGEKHKAAARAALEWLPSDDFHLRLVADGWLDRSDPQAPQAVGLNPQNGILGSAALSPRVRDYPLIDPASEDNRVADWNPDKDWMRDDQFLSQSLRADWNVSDTTQWVTILSHLRVDAKGSDDIQSGFDFYNLESETNAFIDTYSGESRLRGIFGERAQWLLGVNVSRDRANEDHYVLIDTESAFFPVQAPFLAQLAAAGLDFGQIASSLPGVPPSYSGIVEAVEVGNSPLTNRFHSQGRVVNDQAAVFASTDWQFAEAWNLNLGARYTINEQDYHGCSKEAEESVGLGASNLSTFLSFLNAAQYAAQGGTPRPSVAQKGDCFSVGDDGNHDEFHGVLKEDNVSGRVGLDWNPTGRHLFYASFSRGYKAGGFPVLNACCQYQFTPTRQEELLASEAGLKATLFDRRVQANFAAFYYDYRDKQLMTKQKDPVFGPLPVLRNAPRSHVYGAEIDLQARPLNGLFLAASASYIQTQIDEFVSTNDAGDEQDFSNRPFNYSPEYEASLIADYTFFLGGWALGLGGDVQATGATNGTLAQTPAYNMPAYTLVGARLHLQSPNRRWSAALFGRNLTDEFYSTAAFNIGDSIARFAGPPRTYGVTLAYDLR